MALKPGDKAPDFSVYDSEKKSLTLSDFRGKKNVLILFFPLAFTSVCTKELCAVRDDINKYNNAHTEVLGISVDSTYVLARYKADQSYNFPLLSDFNKEVSASYDVIHESFGNMGLKGVSKRSVFIVDKQGLLQHVEILDNPGLMPDFGKIDQILEKLEQA